MEPYAVSNNNKFLSKRKYDEFEETSHYKRDAFQRDRDRIMHSRAFRRMMHKTQIFNANIGDHYRNRLTHTLEVSQIARSIGKNLGLNDELIEAISLGHDLGHTPFGHIGERTLDSLLNEYIPSNGDSPLQSFKHNLQSLRLVDELESRCKDYVGFNLTLAVREGILKHTKILKSNGELFNYHGLIDNDFRLTNTSFTLEGQVVAIADEIAQCTHDLEDGVRSGIISFDDIINNSLVNNVISKYNIRIDKHTKTPAYDTRNHIIKTLIGFLIEDICVSSQKEIDNYMAKYHPTFESKNTCFNEKCIVLSDSIEKQKNELYDMVKTKVICSAIISATDAKSEYIIKQLFRAFYTHPKQLPDYVLVKYCERKSIRFDRISLNDKELQKDSDFIRTICDHIAGMTDQFASREYFRLYVPEHI